MAHFEKSYDHHVLAKKKIQFRDTHWTARRHLLQRHPNDLCRHRPVTKKWETDGFRCPFFSASHGKSYHGIAYTQSFVPSPIWGCYSNPVAPRAHDIHNSGLQKHHPVGPSKSPARLGLLPSIPIFKTTSVPFRLFHFKNRVRWFQAQLLAFSWAKSWSVDHRIQGFSHHFQGPNPNIIAGYWWYGL